ncbi:hypothetical protein DL98DRAFT_605178 [Cadophora sp. DSE1049]|nr:hypothetical protein DL98DRAFT_605178 [Cadophora sp. DSE1049]
MEDYEDYCSYNSSDSDSRSPEPFEQQLCRGEIYNGKVVQISSCDNPNFSTTTIDGRCYNCGGMGEHEQQKVRRSAASKGRQSGYGGYMSEDISTQSTVDQKKYSSRVPNEDVSPPQRNQICMSGYDEGYSGYPTQGASCCRSPNFFTTTRDGTCYNCGRLPDGRKSRYR